MVALIIAGDVLALWDAGYGIAKIESPVNLNPWSKPKSTKVFETPLLFGCFYILVTRRGASFPCGQQYKLTPKPCCVCFHMQIIRPRPSTSGDVVFASDSPINMKGVQFEVPTDTLMAFGAPLLNFERGEVRAGSQTASNFSVD